MVLFFLPSESLFLTFCLFHHSFTFEILFFQDETFLSRKHWSLQLLSKTDLCTRRSQNWKRWWLRNQRQQLKRDTKEWVAANSEVHVFLLILRNNVRSMSHHHPPKSRRKTFFWRTLDCWKLRNFEKELETCCIITPSSLGGKHVFDKHVQFPDNFHKVGNKSANRACSVETGNNLGKNWNYIIFPAS